jgi:hypothetical protein
MGGLAPHFFAQKSDHPSNSSSFELIHPSPKAGPSDPALKTREQARQLPTLEGLLLTDEGQMANTSGAKEPIDGGQIGQHMRGHLSGVKSFKIKGLNEVFGTI